MTQRRPASDANLLVPLDVDPSSTSGTSGMRSAPESQSFDLPDPDEVRGDVLGLELELPPIEGDAPDDLSLELEIPTNHDAPELAAGLPSIDDLHMPSRPAAPRARSNAGMNAVSMRPSVSDALDGDDIDRGNIGFADDVAVEKGYRGPQTGGEPWPTGRTPHGETLPLDEVEVRLASGFGRVPDNLLLEPHYAWGVIVGRRNLEKQVVERKRELVDAESERDKLLIQLVDSARDRIEKDNRLDRVVENVRRIEAKARQRTQKLNTVGDKYRKDRAEIGAELELLAAHTAKGTALLKQTQAELDKRIETYKRADAKHKRVQIEGRNLKAADDRAAADGKPRTNAAKLGQLAATARELAKALEAPLAAVKEAELAVVGIKSRMKDLEKQTADAGKRLEAVEKAYAEQFDTRTETLSEDAREHLTALADAGRALLECQSLIELDERLIERVRTADRLVMDKLTSHETTLRAIHCYDRDAFKRGLIIAGIAGGLILMVLILWIVSPGSPPSTFDDEKYESLVEVERYPAA